jgi:hypothetical protein
MCRAFQHGLVSQLRSIEAKIEKIEAEILTWHRSNEASRRLGRHGAEIEAKIPKILRAWIVRQLRLFLGVE